MIANVTKVRFVKRRHDDGHLSLTMYLQNEDMEYPISPMLHDAWHIDLMCAQLNGEVKSLKQLAFADLSYVVTQANLHGLVVWHWNGGIDAHNDRLQRHYFIYPGKELARVIRSIPNPVKKGQEASGQLSRGDIAWARKHYAPKVRLEFAPHATYGETTLQRYLRCVRYDQPSDRKTEQGHSTLGQQLKSCIIGEVLGARAYSDGDEVLVRLSNDFVADSFYVHVSTQDKMLWNGGIILHKNDDGRPYGYSSHH